VSYRKLNQVTRPFTFPIPRCDDAVDDLPPWAQYFISTDMNAGYWQIEADPETRHKLAFFTPTGKKCWTVMPMGALNAHAVFVAMMSILQKQWDKAAKSKGLKWFGSKVIVDDVLLFASCVMTLLAYFRIVLQTLKHYSATLKLKKTNFLAKHVEFVGVDVNQDGNSPAESKYAAFRKIPAPETWADLLMLVGMFGFYSKWIENYEIRIGWWRLIAKQRPKPGSVTVEEEIQRMKKLWTTNDDLLLAQLKEEVLNKPTLARPDYNRRFYLKTDWSNTAMAAVLCQIDPNDPKSVKAEQDYIEKGLACPFDNNKKTLPLRLRPVAFISRSTSKAETSFHSYVGEASAGRWAMGKWRKYLLGARFTWLADCSGLKRFFECNDHVSAHMLMRWRAEILQFDFDFEHRPASMMTDCDTLNRYNARTAAWREGPVPPLPEGVKSATQLAQQEGTMKKPAARPTAEPEAEEPQACPG
jgi:hypothetical protein